MVLKKNNIKKDFHVSTLVKTLSQSDSGTNRINIGQYLVYLHKICEQVHLTCSCMCDMWCSLYVTACKLYWGFC